MLLRAWRIDGELLNTTGYERIFGPRTGGVLILIITVEVGVGRDEGK
jgi:hypothetical protein